MRDLVMFDVDGTLIDYDDNARPEILALMRKLALVFNIGVWSGGGYHYASDTVKRLGLIEVTVVSAKAGNGLRDRLVFTVDDMQADFGVPNLYVGPVKPNEAWQSAVLAQQARVVASYPNGGPRSQP